MEWSFYKKGQRWWHSYYVPAFNQPLAGVLSGADALLVMVAHDLYRELSLEEITPLLRTPAVKTLSL